MLCKKHPKYKGINPPQSLCKDCWVEFHENADTAYRKHLNQIQRACKHRNMLECSYDDRFGSTWPPRRVCKDCGLAEDGWGVGHILLRTKDEYGPALREHVPLVSRQLVESYQLTLSDKNATLRALGTKE